MQRWESKERREKLERERELSNVVFSERNGQFFFLFRFFFPLFLHFHRRRRSQLEREEGLLQTSLSPLSFLPRTMNQPPPQPPLPSSSRALQGTRPLSQR